MQASSTASSEDREISEAEDALFAAARRFKVRLANLNIRIWAAHVHAAASLPPLTIISPCHRSPYTDHYYGQTNHSFRVSLPLPPYISEDIRHYIATTINVQSPWSSLKGLPHPKKAPLVKLSLLDPPA